LSGSRYLKPPALPVVADCTQSHVPKPLRQTAAIVAGLLLGSAP
jgi:hypothetical protein